jgi:hypothetical protein
MRVKKFSIKIIKKSLEKKKNNVCQNQKTLKLILQNFSA